MSTHRNGALAGVAFTLLGVGGAASGPTEPSFAGAPKEIAAFYADHVDAIMASSSLYLVGGIFLLWFVATLRTVLGAETTAGNVAFAGGVAGASLCLAAAAANTMGALRVDEAGAIDPATATALFDLSSVLFGLAAPMAFAATTLAVAVAALRSDALPSWLGAVSVPLGVALAVPPINHVAVIGFVLWTGLAGATIALGLRQRAARPITLQPSGV